MKFEKRTIDHMECFVSGIYKCIQYGKKWYAYFKPEGWKNWGNACEYTSYEKSREYKTLKQAQKACERHLKRFGNKPQSNDKVFVKTR